jgi:hypothetical protein
MLEAGCGMPGQETVREFPGTGLFKENRSSEMGTIFASKETFRLSPKSKENRSSEMGIFFASEETFRLSPKSVPEVPKSKALWPRISKADAGGA